MNLQSLSIPDYIPTLGIWTAVLAVVLGTFFRPCVRSERVPPSVEWAQQRGGPLGNFRACVHEYRAGLKTVLSGYRTFSKCGQPFILPTTGFDPHVMLPKEHIKWVIDQPEDILSHVMVHGEKSGIKYMFPTFDYTSDLAAVEAIRIHLTRYLGKAQSVLANEMRKSFDAMNEIIPRVVGRLMFGQRLCRNQRFMRYAQRFSMWFGIGTALIGQLVPWQLRRIIGCLVAIPVAYYRALCTAYPWPLLNERFLNMKRQRDDPTFEYSPPEDLITWVFRAAFDMKNTTIDSPKAVASRYSILIPVGMGSTTVTATNTFLDLLASDPQQNYYEVLREEAESAFSTEDDWSQSVALQKLKRADSAIRESLRRNPILLNALSRQVMPKEGVTLPSGQHLQQGAWVAFSAAGIHNDERFYHKPDVYTPFRFLPTETTGEKIDTKPKTAMMVTTSDTFLPFGHARHSCPGRWFVSHVLKLLLAYITIHYDIKPLKERPLNIILGDHSIPPQHTTIFVRRRKIAA
ncbi:cytochrome P450 [Aspergillus bertholletiae]|uniref:Cytochrome P450 n=1 Tax=Aspergillus bertholletiae TaxID=1226010 RepID=A0A5N7B8G3_9EURO|nr:cytochrome P450 [Aspergillus bertholletiae]